MKKPKKLDRSMKMKIPLNSVADETDTGLSIEIDLPGVNPGDLSVTVEAGEIVVAAKRLGVPFGQRFRFSVLKYDPSTVDGELALGVLQVTMAPRPALGVIEVPVLAITGSVSVTSGSV